MNEETKRVGPVAHVTCEGVMGVSFTEASEYGCKLPIGTPLYDHPQPDQSARIAELEAALRDLIEAAESMRGTYGLVQGETPEDSDCYLHDQWAEVFLYERSNAAVAALAKEAPAEPAPGLSDAEIQNVHSAALDGWEPGRGEWRIAFARAIISANEAKVRGSMTDRRELLTDAEIDAAAHADYPGTVPGARRFARAIEAAILRKLAEQEPIAWRAWFDKDNGARWLFTLWPDEERLDVEWQPLYAAPVPRSE